MRKTYFFVTLTTLIVLLGMVLVQPSLAKDQAPTDTSVRPENVAPGDWTSRTAPQKPDPAMIELLKNAYSNCIKQGTPADECKKMFPH